VVGLLCSAGAYRVPTSSSSYLSFREEGKKKYTQKRKREKGRNGIRNAATLMWSRLRIDMKDSPRNTQNLSRKKGARSYWQFGFFRKIKNKKKWLSFGHRFSFLSLYQMCTPLIQKIWRVKSNFPMSTHNLFFKFGPKKGGNTLDWKFLEEDTVDSFSVI
jgi:hypothetical protein